MQMLYNFEMAKWSWLICYSWRTEHAIIRTAALLNWFELR